MIGWGIGPRFGVTCIAYVGTAALLTRRFPEDLTFSRVLYIALATAGMLLIAVGLGAYLLTLMLLLVGQRKGKLVTTGAYRIVRHPLYATWLWLILPGIALLGRSWFMLGVVPIGYAIFKAFIKDEEDELERRFGREYETYRREVNQIFPSIFAAVSRRRRRGCSL